MNAALFLIGCSVYYFPTLGVELTYPTPGLWKNKKVAPSTFSSVERKKTEQEFHFWYVSFFWQSLPMNVFSKTNSFHVSEKWLITWPTVVRALLQAFFVLNPLYPRNDQHQFSPIIKRNGQENEQIDHQRGNAFISYKILWTDWFLTEIQGDRSGEFSCGFWGLKTNLNGA